MGLLSLCMEVLDLENKSWKFKSKCFIITEAEKYGAFILIWKTFSFRFKLCHTILSSLPLKCANYIELHFKPKFTSRGLKNFKRLPLAGIELTTLTPTGSNIECL